MSELKGKIDFTLFVSANGANVNGDPLNGNRPRINLDGYGEMSDVCIKRKIRNRLQDLGQKIFVQSDDRATDSYTSLKDRADGCQELKAQMENKKNANRDACAAIACKEWLDVRMFGQVFAFKNVPVSFGVRGPVSIHQAISLSPIDIISMQITKSVNSESGKDSKASDTMGMKHRVDFAVYKIMGSVNVQLTENGLDFHQFVGILACQYNFHCFSPSRSASTNSRGWNAIRSSAPSPTPMNFTGICKASATAMTMPPLAVPSSLVRAMAVTPAISLNCLA